MVCRRCGNDFNSGQNTGKDGSIKCPECGAVYHKRRQNQEDAGKQTRSEDSRSRARLACKRCGSIDISIQFVQTGSKTKERATTRYQKRGCLYYLLFAWWIWIFKIFTFWTPYNRRAKTKGSSKTTINNQKMAICNNCGHSWRIK